MMLLLLLMLLLILSALQLVVPYEEGCSCPYYRQVHLPCRHIFALQTKMAIDGLTAFSWKPFIHQMDLTDKKVHIIDRAFVRHKEFESPPGD